MTVLSLSLSQAASWIPGARVVGDPATIFSSVAIDSRTLKPGALFVALSGERVDGHQFLKQAATQGASAALVSQAYELGSTTEYARTLVLPALHVPDTRLALGVLARNWRASFTLPVVAVTGSNGKTTVKEMLAAIFAAAVGQEHRLATQGNLNNELGVPLSLLRLQNMHRLAVIELGINHPGETKYLAGLIQPTVALINNAQREHQEFMTSVGAVALEHQGVLHALASDGVAVFPADDPYTSIWREAAGQRRILDFALHDARNPSPHMESAAVQGIAMPDQALGDNTLQIETPAGSISVKLQALGTHNQSNALAATAAALATGVELQAIKQGLESFLPVSGRLALQPITAGALAGIRVIDDSYNANPDSMRAAIDVLAHYASPRVLVMGDMGEVGSQSLAFHHEIGIYARTQGIDTLYTLGKDSYYACKAFGAGATHFDALEPLVRYMQSNGFDKQATVLVKGSRFMKMERVIQKLSDSQCASPHGTH